MVWILKKEGSDGDSNEIKLLPGKEYVVGRKDVDIVLTSDQSISRKHAVIKIKSTASEMLGPGDCRENTVVLVDQSKYGTSVNGHSVTIGVDTVLEDGDLVLFGVFDNRWRIRLNPFVCCTSCLIGDEKTNVLRLVSKLGGQIVTEWRPQCSLLVMNKLTVTIKVVNVLVSLGNIVTPKYLEDYYEAAKNNEKDPDPKNYVPPMEKSNVLDDSVDFAPNVARKTVFRGITFISFASKQVKKLQFTLKKTGAKLKFEDATKFRLVASIADDDICVLQPPKNSVPSDFESKLSSFLKKYDKRIVSEGEVGLSVLHCSRSKHCNPTLNQIDLSSLHGSLLDTQTQQHSSYDAISDTQPASSIKVEEFDADTEVDDSIVRSLAVNHSEISDFDRRTDRTKPTSFCDISSSIVSNVIEREAATQSQSSSFEVTVPNVRTPKLETPLLESKCEPMEYDEEEEEESIRSRLETIVNERTTKNVKSSHSKERKIKKISACDDDDIDDGEREHETVSVVIKLVSLVRKRDFGIRSEITNGETVKNFKRFKKVISKGSRSLTNGEDIAAKRFEMVRSSAVVQSQPFIANGNADNNEEDECTDSANVFDWD